MNDILFLTTSLLFFIWVIRNILFWMNLWQIKEYRFDRLRIHLKETEQGRELLLGKLNVVKNVVLFVYLIIIWSYSFSIFYSLIVFIIYFVSFINILLEVKGKKLKTAKASSPLKKNQQHVSKSK